MYYVQKRIDRVVQALRFYPSGYDLPAGRLSSRIYHPWFRRKSVHPSFFIGTWLSLSRLQDIVTLFFFETLKNVLKRGPYIEFMETVKHVVIVSALGVFYLYLVQDAQDYSRLMLGIMYVIYFFLTYTVRQIWKTILRRRMVIGGDRSLLIVIRAGEAAEAVRNLKKNNYEMFTLSGLVILDRDMTGQKLRVSRLSQAPQTLPCMYVRSGLTRF